MLQLVFDHFHFLEFIFHFYVISERFSTYNPDFKVIVFLFIELLKNYAFGMKTASKAKQPEIIDKKCILYLGLAELLLPERHQAQI